jgi:hypothetical protein
LGLSAWCKTARRRTTDCSQQEPEEFGYPEPGLQLATMTADPVRAMISVPHHGTRSRR